MTQFGARAMRCRYPKGDPKEWCERHARDHAMLAALADATPQ